jgi:hypothetical protein
MTLQVLSGPTIKAGESLSDAADCTAGEVLWIAMPAAWTPAPLTFQFSPDGEFWHDVFDGDAFELQIKTVVPGAGVIVGFAAARAMSHVKFRSGTRLAPVVQAADRVFAITLRA